MARLLETFFNKQFSKTWLHFPGLCDTILILRKLAAKNSR
jgi:hypothetical protein